MSRIERDRVRWPEGEDLAAQLAKAEESLAHLSRLQESILECAGEGIYGTDTDGRITFINPAGAALLGWQPEELVGRPAHETVHHSRPDGSVYRADECSIHESFVLNRVHHSEEEFFWRKDGTSFPISLTCTPIVDDGEVVGGVLVFRDITERKEAQDRIAKSERELREAQQVARVGSWTWSLSTGELTWSDELFRIFGMDPRHDVPTYEVWLERIHPADRASVDAAVGRALAARKDLQFDNRIVLRSGEERTLQCHARFVTDESGGTCVVGTAFDITERVDRERRIAESEDRYRGIFENAVEGIYQSSFDGRLLAINPAGAHILGYDSPEAAQRAIRDLRSIYVDPRRREELISILRERGAVTGYEAQVRRADGQLIWVQLNVRVVNDADRANAFMEGMVLDITARKLAELAVGDQERVQEALERLELQVAHMQKVETLGQLVGGIVHDFNNLLGVIQNYAGFVRAELPEDAPIVHDIDQVLEASERAAALTRQLVTFARRDAAEPRVIDLNEVVLDMEKLLRRTIPQQVRVTTELSARLSPIKVDIGQLEQVIMNLVLNARDAMPDGGDLTLTTCNVVVDERLSGLLGLAEGRFVRLSVRDTGCGIPPATGDRIFEPFFTSKEKGSGTGFGLATVAAHVKRAGGHITFDSHQDRGTTFDVYFPAADVQVDLTGVEVIVPNEGRSHLT
ncbi:MAG: PAS domain S-box protein [Actinomycetota bacterium]|nr:PAS domain S-box protein [Actinomycetota bacterium]